jgi:hypothetical protein
LPSEIKLKLLELASSRFACGQKQQDQEETILRQYPTFLPQNVHEIHHDHAGNIKIRDLQEDR